jgi:hypothetical protein
MGKPKKINVTQVRYRDALQKIVSGCLDPVAVAAEALRSHRSDKRLDLVGWKFSRLLVIFYAGLSMRGVRQRATWLCLCDCGKLTRIEGSTLIRGTTKSCGCLFEDQARQRFLKHGRYAKSESPDEVLGLQKSRHPWQAQVLDRAAARLDAG